MWDFTLKEGFWQLSYGMNIENKATYTLLLKDFLQFMAFIGVNTYKILCNPRPMLKILCYERTEI